MEIPISQELEVICSQITNKHYSVEQWAEIESCDMFQSTSYCGGFDADENEFCFSFYSTNGNEYWFQFSLTTANKITNGERPILSGKVAD